MKRIVVGVDGSEPSRRALQWAVDEARLHGGTVTAVHAWMPPYIGGYPYTSTIFRPGELEQAARQVLDDLVDTVDERDLAAPVERLVAEGAPAKELIDAAKDADLLVVGSRGRGGFTGLLLGSVSQAVCHHATCPVVVIPADAG